MEGVQVAAKGPGPVESPLTIVLFICAILFPGITQVIYGIVSGCDINQVIVGVLQIILAPLLVGWIWSIYWGFIAFKGGNKSGSPAAGP